MDDPTFNNIIAELEKLGPAQGLSMGDLLNFPEELGKLLGWMIRQNSVSTESVAEYLERDQSSTRRLLNLMMVKGLAEIVLKLPDVDPNEQGEQFQVTIRSSRSYRVPKNIWQAFDE